MSRKNWEVNDVKQFSDHAQNISLTASSCYWSDTKIQTCILAAD
jgi:hypothetical protein